MSKPKLALYWAASCGGCEIAVLEMKEKILDVAEAFDIVFWPVAIDFKYKDVEAMDDGSIDVCLFNGAIRNSENEYVAKLLRDKAKIMVAFGACASMGGIPGLANVARQARDHGPRLHAGTVGRQPRARVPADEGDGRGGRARPAGALRHGQDARPDGSRRLLRAGLRRPRPTRSGRS